MKNKFSFSRLISLSLVVAGLSVLAVSCKKGLDQATPIPASGLMVLNLAPDQNGMGVALSGSLLFNSPLAYTSFNGNYQNIYAGNREIAVYDYYSDSTIAKSSFNFQDGELYSLFVTGNNGVYTPLVVNDEVDSSASSDKAYVRFINAIPDSSAPVVTFNLGGNKLVDGPAPYQTVSPFQAVNEGELAVAVDNGGTIKADRNISLSKGNVYTVLVIGEPGATDSTKRVQIRYIQNGVVPASENK